MDAIVAQRRSFGMFMYEILEGLEHILLPQIPEGTEPVFNHLPMVFLNENDLLRVQTRLWEKGIDSARMYLHPNHHIYDLGYPREAFPEATLLAKGLLTLPSHPYMTQRDLEIIIDIVKKPQG
jgi:dTDP-4-amino-4,6-dideoxygalactose transaminase